MATLEDIAKTLSTGTVGNALVISTQRTVTEAAIPAAVSPSNANPQPAGVAAPGVLTTYSRGDHVHPAQTVPAASSANPQPAGVAAPGVSADFSRADHVHAAQAVPAASSATPQPTGVAAPGVSADFSRADHVHASAGVTYATLNTGAADVSSGSADVTLTGLDPGAVYSIDTATLTPTGTTGAIGYAARFYDAGFATLRSSLFGSGFGTLSTSSWQEPAGVYPGPRAVSGSDQIYAPQLASTDGSGNLYLRIIATSASAGTVQIVARARKVSA